MPVFTKKPMIIKLPVNFLIVDDGDLKDNSTLLLDELANEHSYHSEIQLSDVFEYFN